MITEMETAIIPEQKNDPLASPDTMVYQGKLYIRTGEANIGKLEFTKTGVRRTDTGEELKNTVTGPTGRKTFSIGAVGLFTRFEP